MKKWIAAVAAFSAVVSLTACGKKDEPAPTETMLLLTEATEMETTVPETTEAPTTAPTIYIPETEAPTVPQTEETKKEYNLDPKFRRVEETVYATRDVNIRSEPSVNSKSPGKLPKGDSVTRIGTSRDGWSAVIYKDELYYIASEYLSTRPIQNQEPTEPQKVTEQAVSDTVYATRNVNFRKGPGTNYAVISQVPGGTQLSRVAICSNGWSKVSFNGTVGYIANGYLSTTNPEVPVEPEKPTKPDDATKPTESTKPSEDTKPTEDTKPSESTKPSEDTKPSEGTKPSESTTPTESTKPTVDTKPSEDTAAPDTQK